jgi:hypothetical protein
MKAELRLREPSLQWRALARMVEAKRDLREDITLVVESDRVRILDARDCEIPARIPVGQWTVQSIADLDLDSTLSFLKWLEQHFSKETR